MISKQTWAALGLHQNNYDAFHAAVADGYVQLAVFGDCNGPWTVEMPGQTLGYYEDKKRAQLVMSFLTLWITDKGKVIDARLAYEISVLSLLALGRIETNLSEWYDSYCDKDGEGKPIRETMDPDIITEATEVETLVAAIKTANGLPA